MSKLTQEEIMAAMRPKKKGQDNILGIPDETIDVSVTLEEVEAFGNTESIKEMYEDIGSYNRMLKERLTFINPALSNAIPFTRENLYLICGYTGNGKSTIAANISWPLWKQGKKILVIANEESKQDVLFRIACLELNYNFNDYKKGLMPASMQKECALLFPDISKFVKVLDVVYKGGLTTRIEGIKAALEAVKKEDYSAVMIDYFQLIRYSVTDPAKSTYSVLDDLRIYLGRYIKSSDIPVVIFAQLHSMGKRNNVELDSRIKECPGILEPSTVVIEVVPNFEDQTTTFAIKKDRFGHQGMKIDCAFDNGKYIAITAEHIEKTKQNKLNNLLDKAGISRDGEDD